MIGNTHAHQDGYVHRGDNDSPTSGMRDAVYSQHPVGNTTRLDATKGIGRTADGSETSTNPVGSTSSISNTSTRINRGLFTEFFDPCEFSRLVYEMNKENKDGGI